MNASNEGSTNSWRAAHAWRTLELLHVLLTERAPADQIIFRFFRQHKEMGARDRGLVADAAYACLRHRRLYETLTQLASEAPLSERLLGAYLLVEKSLSGRAMERLGAITDPMALAESIRGTDQTQLSLAERYSVPDATFERLQRAFNADELERLMAAMNQPASVDLRINTLKTTRDELRAALAADGLELVPTPFSPDGLRHGERTPLFRRKEFQDGLFEIQDEGSQLISLLVDPRPRDTVIDYCAGAGGKSLHLAALMKNRGSIFATDVHTRRLEELSKRRKRAGADNIRTHELQGDGDPWIGSQLGKADRVLVDAPCSGSGTWRRSPDLKWRDWSIDDLKQIQMEVLSNAAPLVKTGGRLVYATCSLLQCENQDIARTFLEHNPDFSLLNADQCLRSFNLAEQGLSDDDGFLRLLPHRHGTDGFFAAVFERR